MTKKQLIITIITKKSIQLLYMLLSMFLQVKENKVTFASYRSTGLQGNLGYIHNEMKSRNDDLSIIQLFKKYESSLLGKVDYYLHMLKAVYHLSTSRYFIVDDYYLPIYLIQPRKGTEIIQLWHAAGAFKKFGYSTIGKKFGPSPSYLKYVKIHSNYSKVFVSSSEIIPFYAEAFNMPPSGILPLGIPRTDYFLRTEEHVNVKEKLLKRYPEVQGKKIILYAPTFRGKSHQQDEFHCQIDFRQLQGILGKDYVVLVNLHPYIKYGLSVHEELKGFVYEPKEVFTIQELMVISDLLITDYSSVVFEYSLLRKPICFFAKDLQDYKQERDFYYEYKSFIPGPFFNETKEMANWIKQESYDLVAIEQFRNRFFDFLDGQASSRIVDEILKDRIV